MPLYPHGRETAAIMALAPVIPVLTVASVEDGLAQAKALVAGGLYAIEVTLRTPSALEAIKAIANNVPDAVVGAGTIVSPTRSTRPSRRGRSFWSVPAPRRSSPTLRRNRRFRSCLGVRQRQKPWRSGSLGFGRSNSFPPRRSGGVKLLASLAAPLPDLRFCPTGGIDLEKAPDYLRLPNVPCVGGSWMLQKAALAAGDYLAVEALSRDAAGLKRAAA